MTVKADKKAIDWEKIESEYRTGVDTVRRIAEKNGVSHTAVNKRADKHGWTRDAVNRSRNRVTLLPADEMLSAGFVYVIYIDTGLERIYKVGMAKRFDARFDQHQCASPFDICVAICYFVGNMRFEERALHLAFADKRVRGEWFRLDRVDLKTISERSLLV